MKAFVYKNLHKPGYYSIKALEGPCKGKVVGYAESLYIVDAKFKVSMCGRLRVLLTKRKNVHAGIEGRVGNVLGYVPRLDWTPTQDFYFISTKAAPVSVTYDPYKYKTFVHRDTMEPIHEAWIAVIGKKGVEVY